MIDEIKLHHKLGNDVVIDGVIDDHSGIRIIILDSDNSQKQVFLESYVAYRNSDESFRSKFLFDNKSVCGSNSIFKLEKSDYLDWVITQSQNTIDKNGLMHFVIITTNDVFDVITYDEPIVTDLDITESIELVRD